MTDLEKRLIFTLADMVEQHCETEDRLEYTTGFLTANKDALILLTELGVMEDTHPEEKFAERWQRLFYAKFKPNWEWELRDRE